jgi:hypothetical protein
MVVPSGGFSLPRLTLRAPPASAIGSPVQGSITFTKKGSRSSPEPFATFKKTNGYARLPEDRRHFF